MKPDQNRQEQTSVVVARVTAFVQHVVETFGAAGLALGIVRGDELIYSQGFGMRNLETGEPVTPRSLFHLASISKPFVATALMQLVEAGRVELDTPVAAYLPYFNLNDERAARITVQQMLSHTSGMPDPQEYAWHRPETDEGALERYVRSLAGETLIAAPGEKHAYSNAAFEVLGDIIAKVSGQTFEDYVKTHILEPLAMHDSTFLRSEVSPDLATTPHFGMPPVTLPGAYPYHRAHAPSSTLHSSVVDMSHWAIANLRRGTLGGRKILQPSSYDLLWHPYVRTGQEGWNEAVGLSWFSGTFRGRGVISHGGSDPGFNAEFIMVPDEAIAVIVMGNANNPAVWTVADGVLDIVFGLEPPTPKPPVSVVLGSTLATAGMEAAIDQYRQLQATQPDEYDFGADGFFTASWGAIEVRRAEAVVPLVNLWLAVQPEAPHAYEMLGWAQLNDGALEPAASYLRRALALDPENTHVAGLLKQLGAHERV